MGTRSSVLTCTHNVCFEPINFLHRNFEFLQLKDSLYIAWACLHNVRKNLFPIIFSYNVFLILRSQSRLKNIYKLKRAEIVFFIRK